MSEEKKNWWGGIFKITNGQMPLMKKLLAIALAGILVLYFADSMRQTSQKPTAGREKTEVPAGENSTSANNVDLEKQLEAILTQMDGVGEVSVSITYSEGLTREYAVNTNQTEKEIQEKDGSGGTRITTEKAETGEVVMGTGNQEPVLLRESMAKIQGVLVVAQGADDPLVKERLFEAVQSLLQVPAHRVTVCSKKESVQ